MTKARYVETSRRHPSFPRCRCRRADGEFLWLCREGLGDGPAERYAKKQFSYPIPRNFPMSVISLSSRCQMLGRTGADLALQCATRVASSTLDNSWAPDPGGLRQPREAHASRAITCARYKLDPAVVAALENERQGAP